MTLLIYMAPHMGMPNMDIAGMLGSMMNGGQTPAVMSGPWLIGMMMHFVLGTLLFPLLYAYFVYGLLPGRPWAKGLIWGGALWAVMQAMPLPMMGQGLLCKQNAGATSVRHGYADRAFALRRGLWRSGGPAGAVCRRYAARLFPYYGLRITSLRGAVNRLQGSGGDAAAL